MNIPTAQLVFACIMGLAILVWGFSLRLALRMGKEAESNEDQAPWSWRPDERLMANANSRENETESGSRTIRGDKESISKAIGRAILGHSVPGSFNPLFEITERTSERVVAKKDGPLICNQPPSMRFSEIEFNLRQVSESTAKVDYRVAFSQLRKRVRQTALGLILGLGLPVLIGIGITIWFVVVNHPNPAVRFQVLQTLQVVHVLWPPFLVMHQYRSGRKHTRTFVSNLLMMVELRESEFETVNS